MVSPLVQALAYENSVNPVPSSVSPTNVVGAYQLASNVAEQNYQAQLAKNNAFWGGLAGLGGAGMLAFGKPIANNLFPGTSVATPAAGSTAANAAGAGTMPLAAVTAPTDSGILTGGASLGVSPAAFAAQPGLADAGANVGGLGVGPLASMMGSSVAPSVAGDFGGLASLGGAGAASDLAGGAGSVAADLGAAGGTDALASAGADATATVFPDILAALAAFA